MLKKLVLVICVFCIFPLFFFLLYFGGIGGRSFDGIRRNVDFIFIRLFNENKFNFRTKLRTFFPEFHSWESPWYLQGEIGGEPVYGIMGAVVNYQKGSGLLMIRRYNGLKVSVDTKSNVIVLKKLTKLGDSFTDAGVTYYGSTGDDVKICLGDRIEVFTKKPSFWGNIQADGIIFLGPQSCANEN